MTTVEYVSEIVWPGAMSFLPPRMDSPEAKGEILAIGFQESGFTDRVQIGGPARSFWKFEETGIHGVLRHPVAAPMLRPILPVLAVPEWGIYEAIAHNDTLACIMARLLLWTHPNALPARDDPDEGWRQYINLWRPGKPHLVTWEANFQRAWKEIST